MALIKAQDVRGSVTLREYDDGGICESDCKIGVLVDDLLGACYVGRLKRLELVCPTSNLFEECGLSMPADLRHQQIIELSLNERREKQRRGRVGESADTLAVVALALVESGEQTTRIEENHTSPKPDRASSMFSARRGLSLLNSGRRGRG